MGSRFIDLLFMGKGSHDKSSIKGQSYATAIASDPPVKGSYPVAGNGPNVLEEIQRTRAKRQSLTSPTTPSYGADPAPSIPLSRREPDIPRPRTAPHNGKPGGGQQHETKAKNGRPLSGFSMKSPPTFFSNSSRRNSVSSIHKWRSMKGASHDSPPLPTSLPSAPVHIPTYQPKTGGGSRSGYTPPSTPYVHPQQHSRPASIATNTSRRSRSHIDLLDAHSNIDTKRETSIYRQKASGVRNYGEDVADRNIDKFGHKEKNNRDSKLDLTSPEFSYLKQVYSPKKRRGGPRSSQESHSRVDSALGHILGSAGSSDDTSVQPQSQSPSHSRKSSIRSSNGSRPGVIYPLRTNSISANFHQSTRNTAADDVYSPNSNSERRVRTSSPLSNSAPTRNEPLIRSFGAVATPPVAERSRRRASSAKSSTAKSYTNPPRVASPPVRVPIQAYSSEPSAATSSKERRGAPATTSHKPTTTTSTGGGTSSRKSSISYSAFPPQNKRSSQAYVNPASPPLSISRRDMSRREGMPAEGDFKARNSGGMIDLKDSVDIDVTTTTLPGTKRPSTMSRISVISRALSFTAPDLSPLHVPLLY